MSISYNLDIPDAPNNPSQDQPLMKTNTNSINQIIAVDHYSFNDANNFDGLHKQVRMPSLGSNPTPPAGLASGEGTLYTNTVSSRSELFYIPDNTGNVYQLTRTSASSYASFAGVGTGWTFLPGALLMEYGTASSSGTSVGNISVTFSRTFATNPYSITLTVYRNASSTPYTVQVTSFSTSGFTATVFNGLTGAITNGIAIYWMAIGD